MSLNEQNENGDGEKVERWLGVRIRGFDGDRIWRMRKWKGQVIAGRFLA